MYFCVHETLLVTRPLRLLSDGHGALSGGKRYAPSGLLSVGKVNSITWEYSRLVQRVDDNDYHRE